MKRLILIVGLALGILWQAGISNAFFYICPPGTVSTGGLPLTGWSYRKPITITNTGTSTVTDYQIKGTVNTAELITANKMQVNGDDIRFTTSNGITLIDYWIETGINTTVTTIWVEVPSIAASPTTTAIYLYYGNAGAAAASSITSTFIREINGTQPLIGSWNLDETAGTNAPDTSGNGNNGILTNSPTWIDGKFGNALDFDGVTPFDCVNVPANTLDFTNFSILAWVRPASTIVGVIASTYNSTGPVGYILVTNLSANTLNFYTGGAEWITGDFAWDGNWHFIVGTYDGTNGRVYCDGTLLNTSTQNHPVGNQPLTMGKRGDDWAPYNGDIDEVYVYNRNLIQAEITDLYENYGYTTTNYPGRVLVRKRVAGATDPVSAGAPGEEEN